MPNFSQELISEVIAYFGEREDRLIVPEEAEAYLASLAELYWCFTESMRRRELGRRADPPQAGGPNLPLT